MNSAHRQEPYDIQFGGDVATVLRHDRFVPA